jgi:hypothetical protein
MKDALFEVRPVGPVFAKTRSFLPRMHDDSLGKEARSKVEDMFCIIDISNFANVDFPVSPGPIMKSMD